MCPSPHDRDGWRQSTSTTTLHLPIHLALVCVLSCTSPPPHLSLLPTPTRLLTTPPLLNPPSIQLSPSTLRPFSSHPAPSPYQDYGGKGKWMAMASAQEGGFNMVQDERQGEMAATWEQQG
ncbi:unnamed protein product [Cyclocybe aegerita]|uniref:Uncharacterized protein n=1 Tax=Cyclocybe aegerita TaxID=1973307 RepID=A0A8S0VZ26_CYCAE|nr:unnamed protein product [Cyclocybe aegerita]